MKKQIMAGALAGMLLVSTTVFAASADKQITVTPNQMKVIVNGTNVTADNFVYNGTTYLPLRAVSDALGATVGYDDSTKTATITGASSSDAWTVKELKMDAITADVYYQLLIQNGKLYNEIGNLINYTNGSDAAMDKNLETWETRVSAIQSDVAKQKDRVSKYESEDSSYQTFFVESVTVFSNWDAVFNLFSTMETDCKMCKINGYDQDAIRANDDLQKAEDLCNAIENTCQTQRDKYTARMIGE